MATFRIDWRTLAGVLTCAMPLALSGHLQAHPRDAGAAAAAQDSGTPADRSERSKAAVPGDLRIAQNREAAPTQSLPPAGSTAAGSAIAGSWEGSGTTVGVKFGGPPYCSYHVSMQDLTLTASIDAAAQVSSARLTGNMIETVVGRCPYAPIGLKRHTFTGTGSVDAGGIVLEFTPAESNSPHATGIFSGRIVNGRLSGTLTLHRIDGVAGSMAWTLQSAIK